MNPSELFRAFADPTRLRILSLLQVEKEICVCDLCEALDEIQPKISRHLAELRRVGLVEVRQEGRWKFYALASDESPLHRSLVRCVGSCLADFPELQRDRERLEGLELRLRCR
ncbi:MAG: metalloregulator ArsR/SmtB family transcription factor [Deltaproteobacteria bacterium]|jgi:ArsR family transcriptional regulator|nr:metalloregulator ArsR/SmtB family transcription factor [Deltaproteobacteria bacterium]MBW2500501.1 metalloregulator ArsR/SmtB family transcription factor [Deltaproteobacteria bacterium]